MCRLLLQFFSVKYCVLQHKPINLIVHFASTWVVCINSVCCFVRWQKMHKRCSLVCTTSKLVVAVYYSTWYTFSCSELGKLHPWKSVAISSLFSTNTSVYVDLYHSFMLWYYEKAYFCFLLCSMWACGHGSWWCGCGPHCGWHSAQETPPAASLTVR